MLEIVYSNKYDHGIESGDSYIFHIWIMLVNIRSDLLKSHNITTR